MKITTAGLSPIKADYAEFIKEHNDGSDEVSEQTLYEIGYLAFYSYKHTNADLERVLNANGALRIKAETAEQKAKEQTKEAQYEVERVKTAFNVLLSRAIEIEAERDGLKDEVESLQRAVRLYCLGKLSKEELLAEMITANETTPQFSGVE